jgi:hypothetical protein
LNPFDARAHVVSVKRVKHMFDPALYLSFGHLSGRVLSLSPVVNIARTALVVGIFRVKERALAGIFFVCHRGVSSLVDAPTMPKHPHNVNNNYLLTPHFLSC